MNAAPSRSVLTRLAAPVVLVVALAAACGQSVTALSVDGDEVLTRQELDDRVAAREAALGQDLSGEGAGTWTRDAVSEELSWAAQEAAISNFLADRGIEIDDESRQQAEAEVAAAPELAGDSGVRADAYAGYLALQRAVDEGRFTDDDIDAAYEAVFAEPVELTCTRHVLVTTEQAALDVIDRLDAGEDFADVAVEVSTDPSAATNGGDLGCNPEGVLVPEFEAAAAEARVGEVVGPVISQFGYHVIEVLDRRAQTAADLGPGAARDLLFSQALRAADVELDTRYGTWDPQQGVVPPEGAFDPAPTPSLFTEPQG